MSRGREQSGAGGRKSWKRGTIVGPRPVQSKRGLRIFLTVLLIALLVAFIIYVWPESRGDRPFVILPLSSYDRPVVPSVPFVQDEVDNFSNLATADNKLRPRKLTEIRRATEFASLGSQLASFTKVPEDVLFFYVLGHGIVENGTAYLACSDFQRAEPDTGKVSVADVLHDVTGCKAGIKLVLLDVQRLGFDPRLGIAADEFPVLLANEVRKLSAESNVWVVLSCGALQTSSVAFGQKRGVFGQAVSEALSPLADEAPVGDGDRFVSLYEFFRFVEERCDTWFDADSGVSQNPIVMQAGIGELVQLDKKVLGEKKYHILYVPKPTKVAKESSPEPAPPSEPTQQPAKNSATDTKGKSAQNSPSYSGRLPVRLVNYQQNAASENPSAADTRPKDSASKESKATVPPTKDAAVTPAALQEGTAKENTPKDLSATEPAPAPSSTSAAPAPSDEKSAAAPTTPPPAPAPPAPAKPKTPHAEFLSTLDTAWKLRDELRRRVDPLLATPIEFAPHHWRELDATLLRYERMARFTTPTDEPQSGKNEFVALRPDLELLIGDLKKLQSAMSSGTPVDPRAADPRVGNRLIYEWRRYATKQLPADRAFDAEAPAEVRQAKQAWLRYRSLLYDLPNYLGIVGRLGITSELGSQPCQQLAEQLLDSLAEVSRQLAELRASLTDLNDAKRLNDFAKAVNAAEALKQNLDERLRTEEANSLEQIRRPAAQRRLDDLLSTPLFDQPRRSKLTEKLSEGFAAPDFKLPKLARSSSLAASTNRWRRALDRVRLEQKLITLVDRQLAAEFQKQVARIDSLANSTSSSDAAQQGELWQAFRAIGLSLQAFYVGLAKNPTEDNLLLVDVRDVSRLPEEVRFPEFRVRLTLPPNIAISLPSDLNVALERNTPKRLDVTFSATQRLLLDSPIVEEYDRNVLAVKRVNEGAVTPENGQFTRIVTYEVTPKVEQTSAKQARSSLRLITRWMSGGETKEEAKPILFALPFPNRVDLDVVRIGGGKMRYRDQASANANADEASRWPISKTQIELFPNRSTKYQFRLVNRSGQPKSLKVELYQVRTGTRGATVPGRISKDSEKQVIDDLNGNVDATLVGQTAAPLKMSAEPLDDVAVTLVPPGAPAVNPAKPPATDAPAAAAPPPPPVPSVDGNRGFLVRIVNAENPKEMWFKWIELAVLEPKQFLSPKVTYEPVQQRIAISVTPKADNAANFLSLPSDIGEGLDVTWDISGVEIPEGKKQLADKLSDNKPALLYATVPPDNEVREVKLGVDGFPRAFVFDIACREPEQGKFVTGIDVRQSRKRVDILGLVVENQKREYLYFPYVKRELPPSAKPDEQPIKPILLPSKTPAIFSAPCKPIMVRLRADLPTGYVGTQEHVEVTLGDDRSRLVRLNADRQIDFQLTALGEQGDLSFKSMVRDHDVFIDPGSLENDPATLITARLVLSGNDELSQSVQVLLDSDIPIISKVTPPKQITKDAVGRIPFVVVDTSGVSVVEYAMTSDDVTEFPTEADAVKRYTPQPQALGNQFTFEMPVATKGLENGRYRFFVRVTDKIGHVSEPKSALIQIVPPVVVKTPVKNDRVISGVVKLDGEYEVIGSLFKVSIKGPENMTKDPKGDGSFSFTNLPPGMYTVSATGMLRDASMAAGEIMVEASDPKMVKQHVIPVKKVVTPPPK